MPPVRFAALTATYGSLVGVALETLSTLVKVRKSPEDRKEATEHAARSQQLSETVRKSEVRGGGSGVSGGLAAA